MAIQPANQYRPIVKICTGRQDPFILAVFDSYGRGGKLARYAFWLAASYRLNFQSFKERSLLISLQTLSFGQKFLLHQAFSWPVLISWMNQYSVNPPYVVYAVELFAFIEPWLFSVHCRRAWTIHYQIASCQHTFQRILTSAGQQELKGDYDWYRMFL